MARKLERERDAAFSQKTHKTNFSFLRPGNGIVCFCWTFFDSLRLRACFRLQVHSASRFCLDRQLTVVMPITQHQQEHYATAVALTLVLLLLLLLLHRLLLGIPIHAPISATHTDTDMDTDSMGTSLHSTRHSTCFSSFNPND